MLLLAHALTLLHSERPKLYTILVFLSAIGFKLIFQGSAQFFLVIASGPSGLNQC